METPAVNAGDRALLDPHLIHRPDNPTAVPLRAGERTELPQPGPTDTTVPLSRLAWLRSGDKGDIANIGVAARKAEFTPYIWAALSEDAVKTHFAHFARGKVERFHLPGSHSLNLVLHRALGGGGLASLRNDPQGKSFGQILADMEIPVPKTLL